MKEGPLMTDLARKPLQNLHLFMDKAEEFINQEETLRALLGPELHRLHKTQEVVQRLKLDSPQFLDQPRFSWR
jgi:hypothetical protein